MEEVVETTPVLMEALPKGEVDLNLEGWQQNIPDWYNEQTEKGNIVNPGMTFEGVAQYFVIPRWMTEEYNIRSVSDMAEHWRLFQDPQDLSKGVFYNCSIGDQCAKINAVKLEAYGLDKYYNAVQPSSTASLTTILTTAQEKRQAVLGYHWEPTIVMGAYEWHVLEEPAYTDACWQRVTAASVDDGLRPIDQACAYETVPIEKLARKDLLNKAPDVVEMLRTMTVGNEPLSVTLAWGEQNDVADTAQLANYYLLNYEDRWQTWVTPEAFELVKQALQDTAVAE